MFPFGIPVSSMGGGMPVMMGMGGGGVAFLPVMTPDGSVGLMPVMGSAGNGACSFSCRKCGSPMLPLGGDGVTEKHQCAGCGRTIVIDLATMQTISDSSTTSSSSGSGSRSRDDRLRCGHTMTLYHQTDRSSADAIIQSQEFRRGSSGAAGGGIYFATSISDTNRKAHKHGVVLAADVRVGSMKTVSTAGHPFTFSELDRAGYDSVMLTCFSSGDEIVVYNKDQVSNIRKAHAG